VFLRRLYKYGFTHSIIDIEHLLSLSDRKTLRNMQKWEHCLYHLLPPRKDNDIEQLNFNPAVMTLYCLCVTVSYIDVLLLYVVFLTS